MRTTDVARPQAGSQSIFSVVGDAQRLFLAVEGDHRQHRPEDFLARNGVLVLHLVEHGGFDVATTRHYVGTLSTQHQFGAIGHTLVDETQHATGLDLVHHRAHRRIGFQWMARLHPAACLDHARHEFVLDGTLHQQARGRCTDFALVVEDATRRRFGRLVQVMRVGEYDVRTLAAAFHVGTLEVGTTGTLQQVLAHRGRTGEYQTIHVHVQGQRFASTQPVTRHHVEHAGGNTCLHGDLGQTDHAEW